MLATGVKQTTTTTGTGALTLDSVAGYPAISDAFGLNIPFSYTLLDSSGLFLEAGVGYLSSSTVMVRARISATMSGGVYANAAPTALNLSGTTTVIITPHAATLESPLPTVDSQTAGINKMVTTAHRNTTTTGAALVALRLTYVPFLFRCASQVVSLNINVSTAGAAGKVARLGIYACNEKGYPGALLASTSDFLVDTTGIKINTLSSPLSVSPGWFFTAIISDGSPTITMHAPGSSPIGGSPFGYVGTSFVDFRFEVLANTSIPANANTATTAVTAGAQNIPMIYIGVA